MYENERRYDHEQHAMTHIEGSCSDWITFHDERGHHESIEIPITMGIKTKTQNIESYRSDL